MYGDEGNLAGIRTIAPEYSSHGLLFQIMLSPLDTPVEESTEQDVYDPQTVRGRYYYEKLGFKGVEEAKPGVPPHELVALCREYLRGLNWVMACVPYFQLLMLVEFPSRIWLQ